MRTYHGQAARPISPQSVKLDPDVRDEWRRQVAADPDLGPGALRVALVLLNFANRSGFTSVGVGRLAHDLGRDRRNVERGLRQLVGRGHLEREARGGVPGRGGRTCGTVLKVPAAASSKVPAAAAEVPAAAHRSTGDGWQKVPATVAGETLLTHITPAANGPGLEAEAYAANGDTGSATAALGVAGATLWAIPSTSAGPGGEVLRMLGELEAKPRADARPVRDAVLSALREKFGLRPQRAVNDNENSPPADTRGGYGPRVL